MTENLCPEILRPVPDATGELHCNKEDYPIEFLTKDIDGDLCCARDLSVRKKLQTRAIHKIYRGNVAADRGFPVLDFEPYRNIDAYMAANNIDCPDKYCNTYGSSTISHFSAEEDCQDEDNYLYPATLGVETFNRSIPMSVDMCDKLQSEMPSQEWLDIQREYVYSLPEEQKDYLELYSYNGDVILNLFIRNGFTVTQEEIAYMQTEDHMPSFSKTLSRFIQKGGKSYQDYLMDFYNSITKSIVNSPVLDKDIVLYRGNRSDARFQGLENYLYQNIGIMSCSALSHVAMGFVREDDGVMNRVVVPKGYFCLMHAVSKILPEFEFILPDNAKFYVTKPFSHKLYVNSLYVEPVNINTNEIVLVNEKDIDAPILNNIINIPLIFQEQVARKESIENGSLETLFDTSSLEFIKTTLFTMFKEALTVMEKYNYENILQNYNEKIQEKKHFEEIYYLLKAQDTYEKIVLDPMFDLSDVLINGSIKYIENLKNLTINSYITYIKNNYSGYNKDEILGSFYELQIIFSFNEENFNELLLSFTKNKINTIEYLTLIERYENIVNYLKEYKEVFEININDTLINDFQNNFNVTVNNISELFFMNVNLISMYEDVIRKLKMHSILNDMILTEDTRSADDEFSSIQEQDDFDDYNDVVDIDAYTKLTDNYDVIDMIEYIKEAFDEDTMQVQQMGGGMWQRGGFFMTCS